MFASLLWGNISLLHTDLCFTRHGPEQTIQPYGLSDNIGCIFNLKIKISLQGYFKNCLTCFCCVFAREKMNRKMGGWGVLYLLSVGALVFVCFFTYPACSISQIGAKFIAYIMPPVLLRRGLL